MIKTQNTRFIRTAAAPKQFIKDALPQVAFAGRSNVGKSSIINCLLGRNDIARVGASPGKTANINYFLVDEKLYFVDLPGYGFAKVSKQEQERWGRLMESYFNASGSMTCGVQLVDIRHEPMEKDRVMNNWFKETGVPYIIVANKADKISKTAAKESLETMRRELELDETPIFAFSAKTGQGRQEVLSAILTLCGIG